MIWCELLSDEHQRMKLIILTVLFSYYTLFGLLCFGIQMMNTENSVTCFRGCKYNTEDVSCYKLAQAWQAKLGVVSSFCWNFGLTVEMVNPVTASNISVREGEKSYIKLRKIFATWKTRPCKVAIQVNTLFLWVEPLQLSSVVICYILVLSVVYYSSCILFMQLASLAWSLAVSQYMQVHICETGAQKVHIILSKFFCTI
jgi:hypothetical protein